jgi:hypothetical protein
MRYDMEETLEKLLYPLGFVSLGGGLELTFI